MIVSLINGIGRLALALSLAALAAGAAADGRDANPAPGEPIPAPAETVINPTGRIIEMSVPLHYGKFHLGEVAVRLTPAQAVEAEAADILRMVVPHLRPGAASRLEQAAAKAADGYVDLAKLAAEGFAFAFDAATVAIRFEPSIEQKPAGNISIHARQPAPTEGRNTPKAADLAAFLNIRGAADYIGESGTGRQGLQAPRLDLEGAMRWQTLVVEAEGTFEADTPSLFGDGGDGFRRRGTRVIRDFEEEAIRATAGDVYPLGSAFQATPDLLGLTIEHSVAKLQPGRNIRSTGQRSFRIERPSNVDISVNGAVIRQLRLDAGDYNLSDLPISAGANDIVLTIQDDVGQSQTLEFSLFSDRSLLEPGLSEWSLAGGVLSDFEGGEPHYETDRPFITGYYRRGLAETVSGEVHLQSDLGTVMGGAGFLIGTTAGLFSLESAVSLSDEGGWGAAFDGGYTMARIEDAFGMPHSLRLSAKVTTHGFTVPDELGGDRDLLALSANYATQLPNDVTASISAGYGLSAFEAEDSYSAGVSLSRPFGDALTMGLSAAYHTGEADPDDVSLLFRMHYRPDARTGVSALYDPGRSRSSLSGRRDFGEGIGAWQTSIAVQHEGEAVNHDGVEGEALLNASAQYTGNRANIALSQDSRFAGLEGDMLDQRATMRVETAIAYADGHVAVGRPVGNGFAIIAPHAGLADNRLNLGKSAGSATAHTDFLGPVLMSSLSPYVLNRVDYDVADLPPGYDLGEGVFDLLPKHRSGYALKVGSDHTITAIGTLVDEEGAPLPLVTGIATEAAGGGRQVEIFTNRQGRFSAQGLAPGEWLIEMAGEPKRRYVLRVPEGSVGWFRAETLRPADGKEG